MNWLKSLLLSLILLGVMEWTGVATAATLTISCGAVGLQLEECRECVEAWSRKTGHQVYLISTPESTTDRLGLYEKVLDAGAPDIDVMQVDIIWPGLLAHHLVDLKPYAGDRIAAHFSAIIENNTVDGRLVAMPRDTDAGLLYYRKDLLERYGEPVPATWSALAATAKRIQEAERSAGNSKFQGFVWQGDSYEGLTCNALEWIASHNGGTLVDADGEITVNNPNAITALEEAASWIGEISPRSVLEMKEEDARNTFQSGNAVFMRNWPYAWALLDRPDSPVKDKVGVAVLPKGGHNGRHAATLGGWNLAVSRYSRHPSLAADLVMYLTSAEEQKRRALFGSHTPTIAELYKDPEILEAVPFFGELFDTFVDAVPRPSSVTGSKYDQVSKAFWEAVHDVLAGNSSASESLAELERTLRHIRGGEKW